MRTKFALANLRKKGDMWSAANKRRSLLNAIEDQYADTVNELGEKQESQEGWSELVSQGLGLVAGAGTGLVCMGASWFTGPLAVAGCSAAAAAAYTTVKGGVDWAVDENTGQAVEKQAEELEDFSFDITDAESTLSEEKLEELGFTGEDIRDAQKFSGDQLWNFEDKMEDMRDSHHLAYESWAKTSVDSNLLTRGLDWVEGFFEGKNLADQYVSYYDSPVAESPDVSIDPKVYPQSPTEDN